MGRELTTTLTLGRAKHDGKALLETAEIIFRGTRDGERTTFTFRVKDMDRLSARGGKLSFVDRSTGKTASIVLGDAAEAWRDRLLHPPSLLDKLGVTWANAPAVLVIGRAEAGFTGDLRAAGGVTAKAGPVDIAFAFARTPDEVAEGLAAKARLAPAGALWIVYPKGRKELTELDVLRAGRAAGLTDNKVARFSDTLTALRFVIPKAKR